MNGTVSVDEILYSISIARHNHHMYSFHLLVSCVYQVSGADVTALLDHWETRIRPIYVTIYHDNL